MAQSSSSNGGIIAGINVTPLVDITLVLLIIFIVTAKIIVAPAVPLDLPQAAHTEEVQVVFSILMPATGPTLVDGEPVADDAALLAKARAAAAAHPDLRAVINADGDVAHRRVLHAVDLLKTAGVEHIAFGAAALEGRAP
jgi:biopolymer transport protein TolR